MKDTDAHTLVFWQVTSKVDMKTLNKWWKGRDESYNRGVQSIIIQFYFAIAVKHLILIRRLHMIMTHVHIWSWRKESESRCNWKWKYLNSAQLKSCALFLSASSWWTLISETFYICKVCWSHCSHYRYCFLSLYIWAHFKLALKIFL